MGLIAVEFVGPIGELEVRCHAVLDSIAERGNPLGLGATYGRIVGWQSTRRGYVYPAAQFDNRNRPFPGLDREVGRFGNGYAEWIWLTPPQSSLDGATSLILLARGEIDLVADAVWRVLQGVFA